MLTVIVVALALAQQQPAAAAPIYLVCNLETETGQFEVDVTSDEASQLVTFTLPATAHTHTKQALFSATKVTFTDPLGTVGSISYEINRMDLAFTRTIATGGNVVGTDRGKCAVQTAKQAF